MCLSISKRGNIFKDIRVLLLFCISDILSHLSKYSAQRTDIGVGLHLWSGPQVIKLFILNSAEHKIYPAHKC